MTSAAAIVADFERAITLLAEVNDPAATCVGWALRRWLGGEPFEAAVGLSAGWRVALQLAQRDATVDRPLQLLPALTGKQMAQDVSRGLRPTGLKDSQDGIF